MNWAKGQCWKDATKPKIQHVKSGRSASQPECYANDNAGTLNHTFHLPDGASLMVGGFMGVGTPERLIEEIVRQRGRRNLTLICNDTAWPGRGVGRLVSARALRKVIASHIGLNPNTCQKQMSGWRAGGWELGATGHAG